MNCSRRRKDADFGAKNTSAFATRQSAASARRRSASLPAATALAIIRELTLPISEGALFCF